MGRHRIEPARLKPGIARADVPGPRPSDTPPAPGAPRAIRGRALIFWDPKVPGKEARRHRHRSDHAGGRLRLREPRDARRAVEGRLVPLPDARLPRARPPRRDLRDRRRALRHRLVARDEPGRPEGRRRRSRPRDGRRLRPQHGRHLPAQRLQPRAARRAEPGGGRRRAGRRRVRVRPGDAAPHQRDAGQDLRAASPLSPKEDEIRRRGGIFAVGRRELRRSVETRSRDRLARPRRRAPADDDRADRLGAPRRQGRRRRRRARRCASTPTCCRPRTAPRRSRSTRSTRSPAATRSFRARRRSPTITSSSPGSEDDARQTAIGREFAAPARHREAVLRDAGRRHLPLLLSRAGAGPARPVHPGRRLAQPRLRRLRRGRHRRRLDDARVRLGDRLHLLHARAAAARRVPRRAAAVGQRQGHRARAAAALGREAVAGHVGRVRGRRPAAADRLSQHDRQHDGGGRGAERHLRAGRDHRGVVPREGDRRSAVPARRPRAPTRSTRSTRRSTSRRSRR